MHFTAPAQLKKRKQKKHATLSMFIYNHAIIQSVDNLQDCYSHAYLLFHNQTLLYETNSLNVQCVGFRGI